MTITSNSIEAQTCRRCGAVDSTGDACFVDGFCVDCEKWNQWAAAFAASVNVTVTIVDKADKPVRTDYPGDDAKPEVIAQWLQNELAVRWHELDVQATKSERTSWTDEPFAKLRW